MARPNFLMMSKGPQKDQVRNPELYKNGKHTHTNQDLSCVSCRKTYYTEHYVPERDAIFHSQAPHNELQ